MSTAALRTRAVLVAALGGEGGGVLADWIATAIRSAGHVCQTTSIPGVAQRTGATTYYIEYCETPLAELGDAKPVFALTPVPGRVDVMVASELIEAARAVQVGYVTADRTTLIASSHRIYAISERMAMDDGRFSSERALKTVHDLSRRAVCFDMEKVAEETGTVINAVLLGALAGSGALPIEPAHFERAIEAGGKGVEASKRGYARGLAMARGDEAAAAAETPDAPCAKALAARLEDFPVETRFVVSNGLSRTRDYQDEKYAQDYLAAARTLLDADRALGGAARGWRLTIEGARFLALRMTYEDVMRVADLKTRAERFAAIREEARATPDQPIRVTEFLKPGPEEACAVLPPKLAERLLGYLRKRGLEHRFHVGMHIRSDTVSGFLLMRLLARLRVLRRGSWRFAQEKALTSRWLDAVHAAARIDYEFGVAVAAAADLLKGYSGTYRRGMRNFTLLFDRIVDPAIAREQGAAQAVSEATKAALADPDGAAVDAAVEALAAGMEMAGAPRAAGA